MLRIQVKNQEVNMRRKMPINTPFIKYILALLLFGTNGIVASHISLTSYEIVL